MGDPKDPCNYFFAVPQTLNLMLRRPHVASLAVTGMVYTDLVYTCTVTE